MSGHIVLQRAEGLAVFIAATAVYFHSDYNWIVYLLLLFAFDISMIGYAINARIGAITYNIGHSMIAPALLTVLYVFHQSDLVLGLTCLWFAHIGIDRALGYGLKLSSSFHDTHLGKIGK